MLRNIPSFYNPSLVEDIYMVDYLAREAEALAWAKQHNIQPSANDRKKIFLLGIDQQITFCQPNAQLYVGGRNGRGAIEDSDRVCQFIYRNLDVLTKIVSTMDTHFPFQIFFSGFWINDKGEHPPTNTLITEEDVLKGIWKVNPAMAALVKGNYLFLQQCAMHYVRQLTDKGKYSLYIWTYHAMLGGIEHALVPAIHEAIFFHSVARKSQPVHEIKGGRYLTENYSVFAPEVTTGPGGVSIGQKNTDAIKDLLEADMVIIAGQAKSHCVAWSINDLLGEIMVQDPSLVNKVYLLEDCTSPVVIPGVVDFTDQGDAAFERFRAAGMHVVKSTTDIKDWPDSPLK